MRWDTNTKTKPDLYDFDALADTIRMECPHCEHKTYDTPLERRRLTEGKWIPQNTNAQFKKELHMECDITPLGSLERASGRVYKCKESS